MQTYSTVYSKCNKGSSHYLGDKQDLDVSSKGLLSGISILIG